MQNREIAEEIVKELLDSHLIPNGSHLAGKKPRKR
jgi:hypothetical protein